MRPDPKAAGVATVLRPDPQSGQLVPVAFVRPGDRPPPIPKYGRTAEYAVGKTRSTS